MLIRCLVIRIQESSVSPRPMAILHGSPESDSKSYRQATELHLGLEPFGGAL